MYRAELNQVKPAVGLSTVLISNILGLIIIGVGVAGPA